MEDHLRNKNRLEKEWEALCAYQAEPNSSLVAQREENVPKNRCPAVLACTYSAGATGKGGTGCTSVLIVPHVTLMAGKPLSFPTPTPHPLCGNPSPTVKSSVDAPREAVPA